MLNDLRATGLQARGQHAVGLGEFVGQNLELTNRLGAGNALVGGVHRTLHLGMNDGVLGQRGQIGFRLGALGFQPFVGIRQIQRDQSGHERLLIANNQALVDHRRGHYGSLQQTRRHVLATSGDDEVFLTAGDGDEAIFGDIAQIAGVQPAISDLLGSDPRVVVVALAHQRSFDHQLAVLGNAGGDTAHRHADGADAVVLWQAHTHRAAGFGHAVAFQHRHADAVEEVGKLGVHRSAAGDGEVGVRTENRANLLVHHLLVEGVGDASGNRQLLTLLLGLGPFARVLGGAHEHLASESGAGALGGGIVDLLVHTRHGKQQRGAEGLEVLDHRLHIGAQGQRNRAAKTEEFQESGEHMAQGQEQQQTAVGPCAGTRHVLQRGKHQEGEVAVGQFHALRGACRAGCVDDGGAVVAVGGFLVFPEFGVGDAFAVGLDGVQTAGLDYEHVAQGGHLIAHGFDLVTLPVIFGDGERDFGIVENPADLAGGVGLVHRHGERADGHDRHIQRGPFPAGARDDGD